MKSSIITFIQEVENLENELNILLQIEDPVTESLSEKTSQLVTITLEALRLRLQMISNSIQTMYAKSGELDGEDSEGNKIQGTFRGIPAHPAGQTPTHQRVCPRIFSDRKIL